MSERLRSIGIARECARSIRSASGGGAHRIVQHIVTAEIVQTSAVVAAVQEQRTASAEAVRQLFARAYRASSHLDCFSEKAAHRRGRRSPRRLGDHRSRCSDAPAGCVCSATKIRLCVHEHDQLRGDAFARGCSHGSAAHLVGSGRGPVTELGVGLAGGVGSGPKPKCVSLTSRIRGCVNAFDSYQQGHRHQLLRFASGDRSAMLQNDLTA
jgi:hypothetical protein